MKNTWRYHYFTTVYQKSQWYGLPFLRYRASVISRANYFQKTGGCPKSEAPKLIHAKIFQNLKITGKDSIYSKQLKSEEKKRNKPTYGFVKKSLFMQNFRPLFLAVLLATVMWTRQELKIVIYACANSLEGKQIMTPDKIVVGITSSISSWNNAH